MKNKESEKPLGNWKTGLMIAIPIIVLAVIILILALTLGWIKYPFGL